MAKLPKGDVLELGLQIFKLIGEDTHYTPKKIYIYRMFNIVVFVFVLFFIMANCFREEGGILIKSIECAITVIHTFIKYIAFIYAKPQIAGVLDDRLRFWNSEDIDPKLARSSRKIFAHTKRIQKFLLIVFITSANLYLLKPLFNAKNVFPFNVWISDDSLILNLMVLASQYYCLSVITAIVLTYDVTYLSLSIHIIVQLRLLKYKISSATCNKRNELGVCIRHHQLLLSIFARMQQIYSLVLLLQYLMTLGMACVQLYILNTGELDIADTVELIIYLATMYTEFGYYSIPVEEISSEFLDIVNAIYMSSWYEEDVAMKRILLNMMTMAQVPKYLYAGGMIKVNMDTFGSVFRKSFSLYLVLKNLVK